MPTRKMGPGSHPMTPLTRELDLSDTRQVKIDKEARTVELSFSSEEPVERWFGREILDHRQGSVRLGRLKDSGPVLVDHDFRDHVGVVESVKIVGKRGIATVRFGNSQRAQEVFQDIVDGIRKSISVGYRIYRAVLEEEGENGDTYRVVDWEPYEISVVAVGADPTVGIGRAADTEQQYTLEVVAKRQEDQPGKAEPEADEPQENAQRHKAAVELELNVNMRSQQMPTENNPAPDEKGTRGMGPEGADEQAIAKRVRDAELERIRDIADLAERFGMHEEGQRFIRDGKSADLFRDYVLEEVAKKNNVRVERASATDHEIGLSENEADQFSFVRAFNALANPNDRRAQEAAAFEREVSQAFISKRGKQSAGFAVPMEVLRRAAMPGGARPLDWAGRRALNVGTSAQGGDLVATDLLTASFIDLLRAANVLDQMGATFLTDLVGDIAIPRHTGAATTAWIATEGGDASETTPTFDQVAMTPKTLGAFTDITRQLLLQSSIDVEAFVRRELAVAMALELSRVALYGAGTDGEPEGVANLTGIGSVTFAGANPTFGEIVDLESQVANDNALLGNLAYLCNTALRGYAKQTQKFEGTGNTIWEPGNTLNGHRTAVSNQLAAGDLFFGNWADLMIGMWGGLDLLIDPYTKSLSGTVRVVVHQSIDVAGRHPESFALGAPAAP